MTAITFTSLTPPCSPPLPPCSLLTLGPVSLLLSAVALPTGSPDDPSSYIPPPLLPLLEAGRLPYILLPSAEPKQVSLLPYIELFLASLQHLPAPPPRPRVISTTPTAKYAHLGLYHAHHDGCQAEGGSAWSPVEVDCWFEGWETVRYNQTVAVRDPGLKEGGKDAGPAAGAAAAGALTATAPPLAIVTFHPSGLSLGSAYLHFFLPSTSSTVLYAPHYSPRPSRLLPPSTLPLHVPSATTVITCASFPPPSPSSPHSPPSLHRARLLPHPNLPSLTSSLLSPLLPCLRSGGTVLLPLPSLPQNAFHNILLPLLGHFEQQHLHGTYRVFAVSPALHE